MGILNITPDSFFDGNKYVNLNCALERADMMLAEGADIIDIGGESTRPGAKIVSTHEELDRILPVVEHLSNKVNVPISVDTSNPLVMQKAIKAGAKIINDVRALRVPGSIEVIASNKVTVCISHMRGTPSDMQNNTSYKDVVNEVSAFLSKRVTECEFAGIEKSRIFIDPGLGFGKNTKQNILLIKNICKLLNIAAGIVIGISRKSMIGELLGGVDPSKRLYGSLAMTVIAILNGVSIIRTHDIRETVDVLKICNAIKNT